MSVTNFPKNSNYYDHSGGQADSRPEVLQTLRPDKNWATEELRPAEAEKIQKKIQKRFKETSL